MNSEDRGPSIQTFTGRRFYQLDPKPDDISILDIAHALSNQCRFSGHLTEFYSVAEHCIHVSELLPEWLKFAGLLHDASEAYLIDMPSPIKKNTILGAEFRKIEDGIHLAIAAKFSLPKHFQTFEEIHAADDLMLRREAHALFLTPPEWCQGVKGKGITPMSSHEAETMFLRKASEYYLGDYAGAQRF
jgi:uncharacterized protein